jgi:hypothetical protein
MADSDAGRARLRRRILCSLGDGNRATVSRTVSSARERDGMARGRHPFYQLTCAGTCCWARKSCMAPTLPSGTASMRSLRARVTAT